ncbi:MAG: hypothetical protein IPN80_11030 [Flavobacterium sp.]|nr:hypothetical protein [Flavobacterium sp.]
MHSTTRTSVTLTITGAPAAPISTGNITECEQLPIQTLNANNAITVIPGQTISWYTLAVGGVLVPTPTLNTIGTATYFAQAFDGTCDSLTRTSVTLTITGAPATPISTGDITQCLQLPIQTLDANNAITVIPGQTISWYTLAVGGVLVATPTLNTVGTITYFAQANDGTCDSTTRTSVTLTITGAPAAPISTGDITECEELPIQTLDANNAITVIPGQTISWYTLAVGGVLVASPTLNTVGTATYFAQANDGTCDSLTRTSVTLTITGAPAAPISTGDITECEQLPIQTLNANNAITVIPGQTISWYTLAVGGVLVPTPTLNTVGTITYFAQANDGTCDSTTRTSVTLTITGAPAAPISTGDITECEQLPIQTLDANNAITVIPGQTISWYTLAVGGVLVASPTLSAVGTITYFAQVNDGTCDSTTRTSVTLTITGAPAAPISTGDITECEQLPIQTLDANNAITVIPGQTISWYTLAVGGVLVPTPTLNTIGTATYFAQAFDGTCSSLTRTSVILTITGAPAAPISTGDITDCEQLPIQTLNANNAITVIPGQTISWYTLAVGGVLVATPTLNTVGTATYYAQANDGTCDSTTRTSVTLTITGAPAAPISIGNITECEELPIQTLDANNAITVIPGQIISWYNLAIGGVLVPGPTLNAVGTATYYAQVFDGTCNSLTRTAVTLTITGAPAAPISTGNITQCQQLPIQTLNANNAITVIPGQTISWYSLAVGGVLVPTPTLNTVGTITYYAQAFDGTCNSLTRTAVTLTITGAPAAPISTGNITECEQLPIQTLDANNAITVVLGQIISWYDLASGGALVPAPTLNTVGTVTYYAQVFDGTCNSLTRTAVTLTITGAPAAPISTGNITECEQLSIQTLDANDAITTVPGQIISWYDLTSGGVLVPAPTLNTVGTTTYYAESTVGTCNSLTRTAVTLTINIAPAPPVSGGDIFQCEQTPLQTITAVATVPFPQTVIWYDAPNAGTIVPNPSINTAISIVYFAEAFNGTCPSLTRTPVILTINELPADPVVGLLTQPDCFTSTGSITIFPVPAGISYSFDGGPFTTTTFYGLLPNGTNHTIIAKNTGGCLSQPIIVSILPQPSTPAAPTVVITQPTCTLPTGAITINGVPGETYSFDGGPFTNQLVYNGLIAASTHIVKAKKLAAVYQQ